MNKIGFKNFRRFADFKPLEYKGVTFLVGPNNSGKSTFVRALVLFRNNCTTDLPQTFFFDDEGEDGVNDLTYSRALHKGASENMIRFTQHIDQFVFSLAVTSEEDDLSVDVTEFLVADTQLRLLYTFNILYHELTIARYDKRNDDKATEAILKELENEINSLKLQTKKQESNKTSPEYLLMVDQLQALEKKRNTLVHNKENSDEFFYSYTNNYERTNIYRVLTTFLELAKSQHDNEFKKSQESKETSKGFADLRALVQDSKNIRDSFIGFLNKLAGNRLIYLSSFSDKQYGLFLTRDKSNMLAQAIYLFQDWGIEKGMIAYAFVEKWMREFKVGDSFEIISHLSEAFEVNIAKDGRKIPLSDKGKGSIQVMLMLFRLASIIVEIKNSKYSNVTVILEEPELNLHPALQSKLADMFLQLYMEYNINIVAETHSEYILRRSQVLVAEKEFEVAPNENPFNVYYFPETTEVQPYQLNYQSDGTFDKNFGEGFFDEASASTLKLIRLKREKKD